MPIYTAPNHPDCSIECNGAGAALYVEPDGPCLAFCGGSDVSETLLTLFQERGEDLVISVRLNVNRAIIAKLIEGFANERFFSDGTIAEFSEIRRRFNSNRDQKKFSAKISLEHANLQLIFAEINSAIGESKTASVEEDY